MYISSLGNHLSQTWKHSVFLEGTGRNLKTEKRERKNISVESERKKKDQLCNLSNNPRDVSVTEVMGDLFTGHLLHKTDIFVSCTRNNRYERDKDFNLSEQLAQSGKYMSLWKHHAPVSSQQNPL